VTSSSPAGRRDRIMQFATSRRSIVAIWVTSAILNILFLASIVVLGVLYSNNTNELHNQTIALRSSSVSQCQANNENRKQDIAIWDLVEKPTTSRNPATEAKFGRLKQLVAIKDAPRNCVKVYAP
jgi:preprotein translocase subunit SecG